MAKTMQTSIILIEVWLKHAEKMTFTSTFNTFKDFLPPPPPLTESTPRLRSNTGSATNLTLFNNVKCFFYGQIAR